MEHVIRRTAGTGDPHAGQNPRRRARSRTWERRVRRTRPGRLACPGWPLPPDRVRRGTRPHAGSPAHVVRCRLNAADGRSDPLSPVLTPLRTACGLSCRLPVPWCSRPITRGVGPRNPGSSPGGTIAAVAVCRPCGRHAVPRSHADPPRPACSHATRPAGVARPIIRPRHGRDARSNRAPGVHDQRWLRERHRRRPPRGSPSETAPARGERIPGDSRGGTRPPHGGRPPEYALAALGTGSSTGRATAL